MTVIINKEASGKRIRKAMQNAGYKTIASFIKANGYNDGEKVYCWLGGERLPGLVGMVRLAYELDTDIEDLLVVEYQD